MAQTIADIKARLKVADRAEYEVLERSLRGDTRKGVQAALVQAKRRLDAADAEAARLDSLYAYESELAAGGVVVGLDEVGRGPLAGPLTIGAVVLDPAAEKVTGLNDSKQIPEERRGSIAAAAKQASRAWTVVHISPSEIDERGMTACLRKAFSQAVAEIEAQGVIPDVILLDGNPLRLDSREVSVVKGDAKCASISAASVIAKVTRDELMRQYDLEYPGYDFASSKGYGSARHREAIKEHGITPIHRVSFCGNFLQESLF